MEVVSAKLSAIVHATEDVDRVLQALSRVFPDGSVPSRVETRRLHGHYGNEIRTVVLSVRGATASRLLEHLWRGLSSIDRVSILDALDKHLDSSGTLHLRLDKEEILRGILKMKEQDPIKIQLSFRRSIKSDVESNREVGELLDSLENRVRSSTEHSKKVS